MVWMPGNNVCCAKKNAVHLRLGLLLGFFLAVFGITGSMLVFYEEIDNVLNADLRIAQAPKQG